MARKRHIIRKTQPVRYRRIDDQLWPLIVAMVVLGGFLAGSVLAYLRLDDPRWFANAWTWMLVIPLVIAASLVALAWTGNRLLRRTMQLSIILGVIFHVVLIIISVETDVFQRVWVEVLASAERPPQKRVAKLPDFRSWQHDPERRTRRDLERPVEVHVPEPTIDTPRQEQTQLSPPEAAMPPQPVPEPQDVPLPSIVNRPEPNQTVPRQSDELSQLSRKAAPVSSRPTQLVEVPSPVPRPQRRDDAPHPETVGLQPPQHASDELRRPPQQPAEMSEVSPEMQLARRQEQARPELEPSATAASIARRSNRRSIAPQTAANTANQPAAAQGNQATAPQPQATEVAARKQGDPGAPETPQPCRTRSA